MTFEWDLAKDSRNIRKHGIAFEKALSAFYDPYAWHEMDFAHSHQELREKVLGESDYGVIVVVFTRRSNDALRLISARHATRRERTAYAQKRSI